MIWQVKPAEQSTNPCHPEHREFLSQASKECLLVLSACQHHTCAGQNISTSPAKAKCALETPGSIPSRTGKGRHSQRQELNSRATWFVEMHLQYELVFSDRRQGAACYLLNFIEKQSTYFYTAAHGPVPPKADPRVPEEI